MSEMTINKEIFKFLDKSYREALSLTRTSRDYYNSKGRIDKMKLSFDQSLAYTMAMSTITAKLTSSLGWLLVCKALENGEVSFHEINPDVYKLQQFDTLASYDDPRYTTLPENVQDMLKKSHFLYERMQRMEKSIIGSLESSTATVH